MVLGKKIGIVILNYMDPETAESLCRRIQTYSAIDRIVVVDNQSPDNSLQILRKLRDDKTDIISSGGNGGYSSGNNCGAFHLIRKYGVEILYIANPDVSFGEEFIRATAEAICTGKADAVSGIMMKPDGSPGVLTTRINRYADDLLDCTLLLKRLFRTNEKIMERGSGLVQTEFLYGSLFAISAEAFIKASGFDEGVFLYCEEQILAKRLEQQGCRLAIDRSVCYLHRHAVSVGKSVERTDQFRHLYASKQYYYRNYTHTGKIKYFLLKLMMAYGITVRRAVFGVRKLFYQRGGGK